MAEFNMILEECVSSLKSANYDEKSIRAFITRVEKVSTTGHENNILNVFESIILQANLSWVLDPKTENQLTILLSKFSPQSSILSFCSIIPKLNIGARFQLVVSLLDKLFHQHCFTDIIVRECKDLSSHDELSKILVRVVASLPELISNKQQNSLRCHMFHHERFFTFLGFEIVNSVFELSHSVSLGKSIKTEFLSRCIGHFCRIGKADHLFSVFIPSFVAKIKTDFVMQRILHKVFNGIPDVFMEGVLTCLFRAWPVRCNLVHMLGDLVLAKPKAKFVILYKLLLVKHYTTYTVPINVISYISKVDPKHMCAVETLGKVLEVWSSSSSIKHTSYEQHRYLTAVILLCVKHVDEISDQKVKDELMLALMSGMKHHLESPDEKVRLLGMLVGEKLTSALHIESGEAKLEFEFTKTEDTNLLLEIFNCHPSLPDQEFYNEQAKLLSDVRETLQSNDGYSSHKSVYTISKSSFVEMAKVKQIPLSTKDDVTQESSRNTDKENKTLCDSDDSDDDLIPFDLPQETTFTKTPRPMYIRDCLEGLIENEDREKMEIYLHCVDELIHKNVLATKEVAVELCKVMLNLQNSYSIEEFDVLRRRAITSAVVCNPMQVATYLTGEFYSEHYNLQQRMDILDILVMSAGRMSGISSVPKKAVNEDLDKKTDVSENQTSNMVLDKPWKQIVQERIDKKTRRFGKVKKAAPIPTADEFGPVAGYFFFPLMASYDLKIRTLDLLGTDTIVLGRLLYALGTILYSTANSMVAHKMSSSLLEFIVPLRSHVEPFVRKACVFCISMAVVSSLAITEELCEDILEAREWLCGVINTDDDSQTRLAALDALRTLDVKARKELGTNNIAT